MVVIMSEQSVLKHINSIAAGVNRAYDELESVCPIITDELADDVKYEQMCTKAMDALGQSLVMLNLIKLKLKKAESRNESKLENRINRLERLMRK